MSGSQKRRLERATAELGGGAATSSSAGASSSIAPRGSQRRRIERAQDPEPTLADLPLVRTMRKRWAQGDLSSRLVQELAAGAEHQGAVGMEGLSSAATSGNNPQHLQKALFKYVGRPAGTPEFT